MGAPRANWPRIWARTKEVFVSQFLLISYIIATILALAWPVPGKAVVSVSFSVNGHSYAVFKTLNIMIVFLISGMMLKTDDIKKALRHKWGVLFGFVSTLAITPCLGFALREIHLTPEAYTMGLTLTTAVPQTLGIGISLVRSCGGNEGLALMLTTGTNIIGIFTMPPWLRALFAGTSFDLSIDMVALLVNLIISVLVPSVIGKLLRDLSAPVRKFVTTYKTPLSLFSTANLAFIVWQVLSSAQATLLEQPFVGVVYVILLSAGQHIIYLIFNFLVSTLLLRMPPPENVATGVMAAQKSGPVAVAVISYITNDVALQGLMAIPAVIGQLVQVFIGSALVPFFARYTSKFKKAQQVAAEEAAQVAAVAALEGGAGGQPGSGKLGSGATEAGEAGPADGSSSDGEHKPGTGKLSAAESAQSLAEQSAAQEPPQQALEQEAQQPVRRQTTWRRLTKRFQTWRNWPT